MTPRPNAPRAHVLGPAGFAVGALFRLCRGFFYFIITTAVSVRARWKRGQEQPKGNQLHWFSVWLLPRRPSKVVVLCASCLRLSACAHVARVLWECAMAFRRGEVKSATRGGRAAIPQLFPKQFRSSSAAVPQQLRSSSAAAPQSFRVTSAVVPCYLRSRSVLLPQ